MKKKAIAIVILAILMALTASIYLIPEDLEMFIFLPIFALLVAIGAIQATRKGKH